ncbi:MAG: DUF3298 and DUF4163 domain-containing protein [Clostridiaceae bacterium]
MKRTKKIMFYVNCSIILIIILAAVVYIRPMIVKEQQYVNAVNLTNQGKYAEALSALEKVLHYKDSDELIKEVHYKYGTELLNNKEFNKSLEEFQLIPGYKDSAFMIEKIHYQTGLTLMNAKEYLKAADEFEKITKGNTDFYSDAQKKIAECKASIVSLKEFKEDNEYMKIDLQYFSLVGLKDKDVQAKINSDLEKDALDKKSWFEYYAKDYYDTIKKAGSSSFRWTVSSTAKFRYYNNDILSITISYDEYTGGAHGNDTVINYNYDLKTGNKIKLEQLFSSDFDYKNVIVGEIFNQIKSWEDAFFNNAQQKVKNLSGEQDYYIEDGNIVIYYGEYEIAPFASGIVQFKISFTKLTFNKDYTLN